MSTRTGRYRRYVSVQGGTVDLYRLVRCSCILDPNIPLSQLPPQASRVQYVFRYGEMAKWYVMTLGIVFA